MDQAKQEVVKMAKELQAAQDIIREHNWQRMRLSQLQRKKFISATLTQWKKHGYERTLLISKPRNVLIQQRKKQTK